MPKRRQKHSTQPKLRELKSLNKICQILIKTLFMLLNILKELNRFVPKQIISRRKPFLMYMYMYLQISWQPNNQCQGTLHIGRIYCLLFRHGDNGVQRSIN